MGGRILRNILITNDDGIDAPSLWALADRLREIGCVTVVAPRDPRSASGHAISLYRKIAVNRMNADGRGEAYAVDGTPADAVKFALSEIFKSEKVDLIVSGINLGPNAGVSVYYSGTIAAAREAVIAGVPAFAVSLAAFSWDDFSYGTDLAKRVASQYLARELPPDCFLNINIPGVPANEIAGIRVTRQAPSRFVEEFERAGDNEGCDYWLKGKMIVLDSDGRTDQEALDEKFVSITPLMLDMTHYAHLKSAERLASWLRGDVTS
jgi:5'-nucleotidase